MKNKTFLDSIKCAINGLVFGFKTEKNFKYYVFIALFFLVVNILTQAPLWNHLTFIVTTSGVFATEFINTILEHIANMISMEKRKDIKHIKDMAAASVLIWGIAFFTNEIIVIVNEVISLCK